MPRERQDPRIKLEAKDPTSELAQAVLAWAVRGCLEWQAGGLGTVDVIELATEAYRQEQDVVGRFLEECCVGTQTRDPERGGATLADLYLAWRAWATQYGEWVGRDADLAGALEDRGFTKMMHRRRRCFPEIALRPIGIYGP